MKLKKIIGLALTSAIGIGGFAVLSITSYAAESASYTWDLTNCGEASGYVTPAGETAQNNFTTLVSGENVSTEYTNRITAPTDGMLSFNLSRDTNKATISADGLYAPGNGAHIYFYSSKQGTLTVYASNNIKYAISNNASSGYGSENQANVESGVVSITVEAGKYYRIRSTGSEITYTKLVFNSETDQIYTFRSAAYTNEKIYENIRVKFKENSDDGKEYLSEFNVETRIRVDSDAGVSVTIKNVPDKYDIEKVELY